MFTLRISPITPCTMGDVLSLLNSLHLGVPNTFHRKLESSYVYIVSYTECCISDALRAKLEAYEQKRKCQVLSPYTVTDVRRDTLQLQMYYISIV